MLRQGDCYLVGAGEFAPARFAPRTQDAVYAVDGGCAPLLRRGCRIDLLVGDLDSLSAPPPGVPLERHPARKDDTDMLLAARRALGAGFARLLLFGGVGGRPDHTLANLQVLNFIAAEGALGFLFGPGYIFCAAPPGVLRFDPRCRGAFSLFCFGEPARGVTLDGLEYPLDRAEVHSRFPIGVSNRFTGAAAAVWLQSGVLTLYWQDDDPTIPLPVWERPAG